MHAQEELLNRDLKVFIEEYLALTEPGSHLIRFDFFRLPQKPERWQLTLLVDRGQQQTLMDSAGNTLCSYGQLTPLFRLQQAPGAEALVDDLRDQLLGLRSKASSPALHAAVRSLDTLCCPFRSLSGAYLVKQDGCFGVVDPLGQVLIPPRYRQIEPFSFQDTVGPDGVVHGQTGLYLCSGDLHRLNSMDVYDLKGNLIFEEVAGVYPREEVLVTAAPESEPCAAPLPGLKQLRSLWISRRQAVSPFPEAPQLQSVADENHRFSLRELYRPVSGDLRIGTVDSGPVWDKDPWNARALKAINRGDASVLASLKPMAEALGAKTGHQPEQLLQRLGDYENFRRERQAAKPPLTGVTANTELSRLGLTARTYNCLVRNGIRTAGEIAGLSNEQLSHFRRSQPQTLQEITALREQLRKRQ